jgi:hypothetical protein
MDQPISPKSLYFKENLIESISIILKSIDIWINNMQN